MRSLKSDKWKAGISLAGLLLFLVLIVCVPAAAADARVGISGLATPGTSQATPTVDLTVTSLAKEQMTLQVKQLQNQTQDQNNWLANNSTALIAAVATVIVALFGISQWAINRRDERRKEVIAQDKDLKAQAEERFKTAVTALGDEKESVQVGGAILLRSFLNKEDEKIYGRYYAQIFDLAVAYLRPSNTSLLSEYPDETFSSSEDPHTPLPLTPLRQALIVVFREVFPLAREETSLSLDATGIQLDHAYLAGADLKQVRMPYSSLRKADFVFASLHAVYLRRSHLEGAQFTGARLTDGNLTIAHLKGANFNGAYLEEANLGGADLEEAHFQNSHLKWAQLGNANLTGADLSGADLSGAKLDKANLNGSNLSGTNLEEAKSLKGTDLRGVKGLTKEQLIACKARGAIIDEDTTASLPQLTPPSASAPTMPPTSAHQSS